MRRVLLQLAAVVTLATGCAKGGGPTASGALDASDKAMFRYLPATATIVLGGNLFKLQDFLRESLNNGWYAGTPEWISCLAALKGTKLAGAVTLGKELSMRVMISGPTLDDISGCGQKASFRTALASDHKALTVEQTLAFGATGAVVFLMVPSGALYTRIPLGKTQIVSASRADLESDIAGLKDTVADDVTLKPLIEGLDRSKTGWFVLRGKDTQLADILNNVWGTFDVSFTLALDVTGQMSSESDAEQVERDYDRLRSSASGERKALAEALELKRSGSELHVAGPITGSQLEMISQLTSTASAPR